MANSNETFLSRVQQARRWGVSKYTVERWGKDERLGLPGEILITNRRYRRLSELEAWERSRAVAAATNRFEHGPSEKERLSNRPP
jgi:hypothetical protein